MNMTLVRFAQRALFRLKSMTGRFLLVGIIVCSLSGAAVGQSVNVPLQHRVYGYLDRMEARGCFRSLELRARPISRADVAELLGRIEQASFENRVRLSHAELDLLEQLKGEFCDEMAKHPVQVNDDYRERHLLVWNEDKNTINVDIDFAQRFDITRFLCEDSTARTSLTTLGGILRGNLNESLGFYLHFTNALLRGVDIERENFNPEYGLPITIAGDNVYQDNAAAYFVWKLPWFQLQFGRDQAQWGPGYQGSLMLSAQNPLFDMLKIRANYHRFHFTSIHGKLNSSAAQKYLAAHRIEFRVLPWLFLAGSESVVYGDRGIEWQYVNPIMPYHIAEHHLGDKDNNTMSFDFTMFPWPGHKVYGELFLDDFTTSENPFTYFGNKFAFLTGYHWANPLSVPNLDLKAEYARVEPFVYTHHVPVNVYQHYDRIIGHWLGPNSDQLYFEAGYLFNRDMNLSLIAERIRDGKGDVSTFHTVAMGNEKKFLSGIVEESWRFGFSFTDQILRDFFLNLQYHSIQFYNTEHVSGRNSCDSQIIFQLTVNW
ncbi:MAG: capsule assembly Wzi family protein [Candidatus Zhuqueibacterota bacterium]